MTIRTPLDIGQWRQNRHLIVAGHRPTKAPNGKAALSSITTSAHRWSDGMEVLLGKTFGRHQKETHHELHTNSKIDLERISYSRYDATFHKSNAQRVNSQRIKHLRNNPPATFNTGTNKHDRWNTVKRNTTSPPFSTPFQESTAVSPRNPRYKRLMRPKMLVLAEFLLSWLLLNGTFM